MSTRTTHLRSALRYTLYIIHYTLGLAATAALAAPPAADLWRDPSQPIAARVNDLIPRLTLREKISQLSCDPLAIPRLGIPTYSYRNECLHGIVTGKAEYANAGSGENDSFTTNFPQAIGMAATWNTDLIQQEADCISTEARARYNDCAAKNNGNIVMRHGLTYYSPNINIYRDPRWGRGQETYGEDPFLTSRIAIAYIHGLQGDNPDHIKIMACAKHYAVHSGPEKIRHAMNMSPTARDLHETYLPAFEAAVREGRVGSVMGVYSSLYGTPGCASPLLIQDILRGQWGFDGLHISDGGALWDIWGGHHYKPTPEESVAAALKAGCDLASGNVQPAQPGMAPDAGFRPNTKGWNGGGMDYNMLQTAFEKNLVTEADIDRALRNALTARFRVGLFDPPDATPWSKLTQATDVDTPAHRALALKVAEESIVLLKNDGILPLDPAKYKHIAVIGPNADSTRMLLANYHGRPSQSITILQGIRQLAPPSTTITHQRGCPITTRLPDPKPTTAHAATKTPAKPRPKTGDEYTGAENTNTDPADTEKALAAAATADLIIFVGGLNGDLECEENKSPNYHYEGFDTGDRTTIELPAPQHTLLQKLHATGKPIILVNCSGGAIAMPWETRNLPAILQAWYPGQSGGLAIAEILYGKVNPSGRLPVTFYAATTDLPDFADYSMANRTYRYHTGKPEYAFGHGLSYTTYDYAAATLAAPAAPPDGALHLTLTLKNTGPRDGAETPQVYYRRLPPPHPTAPDPNASERTAPDPEPNETLCAFAKVDIPKGTSKTITLEIPAQRLRRWDAVQNRYEVPPGAYELLLGPASDDIRHRLPFKIE